MTTIRTIKCDGCGATLSETSPEFYAWTKIEQSNPNYLIDFKDLHYCPNCELIVRPKTDSIQTQLDVHVPFNAAPMGTPKGV